jgi:hypothetical protein
MILSAPRFSTASSARFQLALDSSVDPQPHVSLVVNHIAGDDQAKRRYVNHEEPVELFGVDAVGCRWSVRRRSRPLS